MDKEYGFSSSDKLYTLVLPESWLRAPLEQIPKVSWPTPGFHSVIINIPLTIVGVNNHGYRLLQSPFRILSTHERSTTDPYNSGSLDRQRYLLETEQGQVACENNSVTSVPVDNQGKVQERQSRASRCPIIALSNVVRPTMGEPHLLSRSCKGAGWSDVRT